MKRTTGFMSNTVCLLAALRKRCFGKHGPCSRLGSGQHEELATRVAIFSDAMREMILHGFST